MGETIDYGAVFGIDMSKASGNTQEVADPAAESNQGENGQEIADPVNQEIDPEDNLQEADPQNIGEAGEGAAEGGAAEGETNGDNAKYAAARRRAEAEAQAKIAKMQAEVQTQVQAEVNKVIIGMGLKDPYTGKDIVTMEEYEAYKQKFDAELTENELTKAGLSKEAVDKIIQAHPKVKEAEAATQQLAIEQAKAREAAEKAEVEEQMRQINELDPSIKSIEDFAKMPKYQEFYGYVKRGMSFIEAYNLANMETLKQKAAAASKQQAINLTQGKQHLEQTSSRGKGAVTVPAKVVEQYRVFNPKATMAEIQKHYNKEMSRKKG